MPPIGLLMGGVDFSDLMVTLKAAADGGEAVALRYGAFINTLLDFLIVAVAIFLVVKVMNSLKKGPPAPEAPPAPSAEAQLLAEIRDVLKSRA
jgi:large conductance mechanosensitive channel